jgi:hypothetical protein
MSNDPVDLGAPEIFFDQVGDIKIIEGVVRMALLTRHDGESIVSARLAIPLSELPEVIQSLVIALTEAAKVIVKPVLSS